MSPLERCCFNLGRYATALCADLTDWVFWRLLDPTLRRIDHDDRRSHHAH